jgi:hypothetical protein
MASVFTADELVKLVRFYRIGLRRIMMATLAGKDRLRNMAEQTYYHGQKREAKKLKLTKEESRVWLRVFGVKDFIVDISEYERNILNQIRKKQAKVVPKKNHRGKARPKLQNS